METNYIYMVDQYMTRRSLIVIQIVQGKNIAVFRPNLLSILLNYSPLNLMKFTIEDTTIK